MANAKLEELSMLENQLATLQRQLSYAADPDTEIILIEHITETKNDIKKLKTTIRDGRD